MSDAKKGHRDRKNPHAAEAHKARKAAFNASRPKQLTVVTQDDEIVGPSRVYSLGEGDA